MTHPLGTFRLRPKDKAALLSVAESNWLSPGAKVKAFEYAISALHGNKFGVMTNSGTDALRIALASLKELYKWNDGDKVIVPAITFVATANIVLQCNMVPVFADVDMYHFNINPDNILRRFFQDGHDKTIRAIIPVHLAGLPADMKSILKIAKDHNLKVIEDSCESIAVDGIGQADITCFSFYMAHLLTTGVGGMAITNNYQLERLMWSYCNHGRRNPQEFVFDRIGYSCRPTEFEAALGLSQLDRLSGDILERRHNFHNLYYNLKEIPDLYVYSIVANKSAAMFFPILIRESSKVHKRDLMAHLNKNGIETRDLMPLINQPCYKQYLGEQNSFSVAESVNKNGFYIGCHQDLTIGILKNTVKVFKEFFHRASQPG